MKKNGLILLFLFFKIGFLFSAQRADQILLSSVPLEDDDKNQDNPHLKRACITLYSKGGINPEEHEQGEFPSSSPKVKKESNHLLPVDLGQFSRLKAGGFEDFLIFIRSLKDFAFISSPDSSPSDYPILIVSKLEQLLFVYFQQYPQRQETFDKIKFLNFYFGQDFLSFIEAMHVLYPKE